jgi:hypothetical protein
MFERLVTAKYLHLHPEETENYLDYHHIAAYKLAREMFDTPGADMLTAEMLAEKKRLRDEVKAKFRRPCSEKGCDRIVQSYTWSKLDLISMAKECGSGIGGLVGICYYVPMQYTHPSVQSILSNVVVRDGILSFAFENSSEWSSKALIAAHNLVLRALELQADHFPEIKGTLNPLLEECVSSFNRAWKPTPSSDPA